MSEPKHTHGKLITEAANNISPLTNCYKWTAEVGSSSGAAFIRQGLNALVWFDSEVTALYHGPGNER